MKMNAIVSAVGWIEIMMRLDYKQKMVEIFLLMKMMKYICCLSWLSWEDF